MTAIISTVGSSILGSVATKTFDSLVTSKYTSKSDKKKWIREKTLILFSDLTSEVDSITCNNLEEKRTKVRQLVSKINLLVENRKLQTNLKNYSFILDEYQCFKDEINLDHINEDLVNSLKVYMNKM